MDLEVELKLTFEHQNSTHGPDDTYSMTSGGLETDNDNDGSYLDSKEKLPFIPEFIYGLSRGLGVLNFGNGIICYAAAHYTVILNYENNSQSLLMGHKNAVSSISTDVARNVLVTADSGPRESFVYLWKKDQWTEPMAILKPPAKHGTRFLALSQDGKYLITLSEGLPKAVLNLWEISNEKLITDSQPSAVLELSEEDGKAQEVAFCADCTEFSMVTCTRNVRFLNWSSDHWTDFYSEQMSRVVGRMKSSIYISGTTRAATITSHGCVLIWEEKFNPAQPSNQKVNVDLVKLEQHALTAICETDGVLAIGDDRGQIRFYDQSFKTLLFWYNLEGRESIISMSFAVDPGKSQGQHVQLKVPLLNMEDVPSFPSVAIESGPLMVDPRCISDCKNLRNDLMGPQDMNAEGSEFDIKLPIVPRDVILHTDKGRTFLVSIRHMRCITLSNLVVEATCISTHPSKCHLIVGNSIGELKIYHYEQRELLLSTKVWHSPLTSVRVSPDGHTLFVGTADGTVIFLHPILLNLLSHRGVHHHNNAVVLGPVYSNDSQYMAHYDSEGYVAAYRCLDRVKCRWLYLGKRMIHHSPVRTLLFGQEDSNAPLFSTGMDSLLVEYDVVNSIGDSLLVKRQDRVSLDFTSNCMVWCPSPPQIGPALLLSFHERQLKVYSLSDRSKMLTANGPFLPNPIFHMHNLHSFSSRPHSSEGERVAVFVTKCSLGLMKCPTEGSPFDIVATFGDPHQIGAVALSGDQKYAFTFGRNDTTITMYKVNLRALEIRLEMSPPGLDPFLYRLDGGKDGWLFREMIHSFCYAQILHQGVKSRKVREIGNRLPLCEIPDLIRAVGVFPSQHSLKGMTQEVAWRGLLCNGTPGNSLTFEDFVKLVVGHHPGKGVELSGVKEAFDAIGHAIDEHESVISRDRFISALTEKGEAMSLVELRECCIALLGKQAVVTENEGENVFFMDEQLERNRMFSFLPDDVTFTYLIEQLLGIIVKTA